MYQEILTAIKEFECIIIHRHSKPDGDAMGSQIGLKKWMNHHFPDKRVFQVGDDAGRFSFMDGSVMDIVPDSCYEGSLAILLDTAVPALISDNRYQLAKKTIRFDHHLYVAKFTDLECVDSTFESCCGLLTDFILNSGYPLTPECALPLYTGMVTDSGRFRYDSTTPRTLRLAAALLEQGFDLNELYRNLYSETIEKMQIKAAFINKIRTLPGNVAFITTTSEELEKLGMDPFTASRGMVGVMADIAGIDTWVNFTQSEEGVLCELRSSKYNIQPVAVKYGGGGHAKASGAVVPDFETAMKMVADLQSLAAD